MKSFIKTAALSFLTVSSLSLTVATQAEAFTPSSKSLDSITNQTIYRPQIELDKSQAQVSKEELVAYSTICETNVINGRVVTCCADSSGYWACVY